ncbi:DNA transposase [Frankliniella fusca]|uniref:DNA transposase n=1 Tax=Frankliniella fusca TaxID=407009 RepID=A0AAE1LKB3_9NEOP|nr:DNA transposase [Frankliniella fusca]
MQDKIPDWEKRISRAGWKMKSSDKVCELHFEEKYILVSHDILIDGRDVGGQRGRKKLSPDAVPTIFSGYPSYRNRRAPKKRETPSRAACGPVTKKRRPNKTQNTQEESFVEQILPTQDLIPEAEEEILMNRPLTIIEFIMEEPGAVQRPENWHIHKGPDFLSFVHIHPTVIQIDKYIKFLTAYREALVYLNGKKILSEDVENAEEVNNLLERVNQMVPCPGSGYEQDSKKNQGPDKCCGYLVPSGVKKKNTTSLFPMKTIAKGISRGVAQKVRKAHTAQQKAKERKSLKEKLDCRNKKVAQLKKEIENLQDKFKTLEKGKFDNYISSFPPKWRAAMKSCMAASSVKDIHGRRYTSQWVYECQLLRIKSLGLYKKMLRDNFLPLPSLRTLQRYMVKLKPAYGFLENTFTMMAEKGKYLPEPQRHGALLIDESKLSEGVHFDKHSLKVKGLVYLGDHTPEQLRDISADHALVMIFQSFQGQYFQTISAHLSKGAVKGLELSKLVLEVIALIEKSGFSVDAVVSDAASWNRNMWSRFGLQKKDDEKQHSKQKYTVDDEEDEEDVDELDQYETANPYRTRVINTKQNKQRKKKKTVPKQRKGKHHQQQQKEQPVFQASCTHPVDTRRT